MKRSPFFVTVCLLVFVCLALVIAGTITYRKKLLAKRLDRLLSFTESAIDECTIAYYSDSDKIGTLKGSDAHAFADRSAETVRRHCRAIHKDIRLAAICSCQATFRSGYSTWKFGIASIPGTKASIDYQTKIPSLPEGTIILDEEAGPQLEHLLRSALPEEVEPAPASEQITTGPPAPL